MWDIKSTIKIKLMYDSKLIKDMQNKNNILNSQWQSLGECDIRIGNTAQCLYTCLASVST